MIGPHRLLLAMTFAITVGAAQAAEPEAVATAPAASTGAPTLSVADQIDTYLRTSPAAQLPRDRALGVTSGAEEPRRIHGIVDVAVGTNGYRSAYVQSDVPVGKTGTLTIAAGETKFEGRTGRGYAGRGYAGRFGPGDRQSLSLGLALGGADAALDPHDPRCRQVREDGPNGFADPRLEGGRSRLCLSAEPRATP